MRASYRIPNASRGQYAREYRLMVLWAALAQGDDVNTILRECGLSPAGSPPSVMRSVYDYRHDEDGTEGYAKEPPQGPTPQELADAEVVTRFMEQLRVFLPSAHAALMARHRRMLDGQRYQLFPEWRLALHIYGRGKRQAHRRLDQDCDAGYASLRNWLCVEKAA